MDADRALLDLADANGGLLRRGSVRDAGVTKRQWLRRVDRGEWVHVCADVWRHALVADTWQLHARAGLLHLGRDAALFGLTSAAWWELDVPSPSPREVEFVVPRPRRKLPKDLEVHTRANWELRDFLRRDGLKLTTVTRTVIDMAGAGCSAHVIEKAIDSGMHMRRTTLPTLTKRMEELGGSGQAGIRLLRALLLDSGGESLLERKFLALVRRNRLPKPTCQVVHREGGDGRVIRVDFDFPGTRVIVEVSGRLGHVSDRDRQRDARRRNVLLQAGFQVREFTTADVLDDEPYVVTTLREALVSFTRHRDGSV